MVQYIKKLFRKLDDAPIPEKDPIVHSSLGLPLAISAFLLILSLIWAFYMETAGLRPWRAYQEEFGQLYQNALKKIRPQRAAEAGAIRNSEGYLTLQEELQQAETDVQSQLSTVEGEEQNIRERLAVLTKPFADARSELQATIYRWETVKSESVGERLSHEVEALRAKSFSFQFLDGDSVTYTYEELENTFNGLKNRQGELQAEKVSLLRRPTEMRSEMNAYMNDRLTGLTETQIDGLINKTETMGVFIRQIHNEEMNLVDRCESCHMGAREPVDLSADQMDGRSLFASHPRRDLLAIHDPETFGCTPCHNGNGIGTVSTVRAHGKYKHWLRPLYDKENFEAGCIQCHRLDRHLEGAHTFNAAKDAFQHRGCMGCHAYEGFDTEPAQMREVHKNLQDLNADRITTQIAVERLLEKGDGAETNEEAQLAYTEATRVTQSIATIDADLARLNVRLDELLMERKRPGPNLKEVRNKLTKEWIPKWISNPQAFRPNTKMPQFRLKKAEIEAISAFLWQSGVNEPVASQPMGDAVSGKGLFDSKGCLACHSVGEEEDRLGGDFAANLSRVGEKTNYDYLVRWIHNPKERSLPYDPVLKHDVTREDYETRGLPFQFDPENNQSPLGNHSLQVQNSTVMPNLRLTWEESRDIGTYLAALKKETAPLPAAPFLEDTKLFERGRFLTRHYGCAGCHEIAGLEDEGKIGTDLTVEGSKPLERLDFALLTHKAKHDGWYNHKGFFERKLKKPAIYDQGKIKRDLEKLRMPDFHLDDKDVDQLTTFLLGSVESIVPPQFHNTPSGQRQDVQKGWDLVKKYNCMGCHQFTPGQSKTVMAELPFYGGSLAEKLPPSLVGQGARTNPEWLKRFLKNPALNSASPHRNGVRPYLDVRMPTFALSDNEVGTLARFFQALSKQPTPYIPPELAPLTNRERSMARELFTSNAAPCLRCHATGDEHTDPEKIAPNLSLVKARLKPDWTQRWLVHPEIIRPGTAMPSGLFRREGDRWVFSLANFRSFKGYTKDEAELVVRYMFEYTPEEQRRLTRGR